MFVFHKVYEYNELLLKFENNALIEASKKLIQLNPNLLFQP